jgi:hypothetical protein
MCMIWLQNALDGSLYGFFPKFKTIALGSMYYLGRGDLFSSKSSNKLFILIDLNANDFIFLSSFPNFIQIVSFNDLFIFF